MQARAHNKATRRSFVGWVKGRLNFFREVYTELSKVVWPSRRDTRHLTIIVIIVSVAVGLFLGAVDLGFFYLVNEVFLRGR